MVRLGAVTYLNARPLVYGLERKSERFSIRYDVPSECARLLHARRVDVVMSSHQAEGLVEELSRTRLEAFAALASSLEIPVRQQLEITIPAVGPEGPVRIAAASLPLRLRLLGVQAFHGKLWISMEASTGAPAARAPPPRPWFRPPTGESTCAGCPVTKGCSGSGTSTSVSTRGSRPCSHASPACA